MSLPSILPTDSVTILWMLWEGDVDSYQRRAILQWDATSNHSYPAGEKKTKTQQKTGSEECMREGNDDRFTKMENIIIVWTERHIVIHEPKDLVHKEKKQPHLFCSVQFPSLAERYLPEIAKIQGP